MGITDEEIFGKQEEAQMDEKLYSTADPASDDFEQDPVEENAMDIKLTLGNIEYDIDDEPDFEGDPEEIEKVLSDLPETIEVCLNGAEVPEKDADKFIYQKACEQTGLPIKNAIIIDIEEIKKEDVKEEDIDMSSTEDMVSNEAGGLENISSANEESSISDVDIVDDDIVA